MDQMDAGGRLSEPWLGRVGLSGATPDINVSTSAVTSGPITRRIVAVGTVQAVTTVEVGAEVSGVVQSLEADYNSPVHAGQVIARIDPAAYDARAREARAALAQAQATSARARADLARFEAAVDDARTKLSRAVALSRTQLIPQSDLDAAGIALGTATADLAAGEAAVDQADAAAREAAAAVEQATIDVDHTIIRSPIDGIAIERDVSVGQTLAASIQPPVLFRIAADLKQMQVQVDVDESDVAGLTPGEPATFEVESYRDETFRGTVAQVRTQPLAAPPAPAPVCRARFRGGRRPVGRQLRGDRRRGQCRRAAEARHDRAGRARWRAARACGPDSRSRAAISSAAGGVARARRKRCADSGTSDGLGVRRHTTHTDCPYAPASRATDGLNS